MSNYHEMKTVLVNMLNVVDAKISMLEWQKQGLQYTTTGYGKKIPSRYQVKIDSRWYRVYVVCYSNSGTCYIVKNGKNYPIMLDGTISQFIN